MLLTIIIFGFHIVWINSKKCEIQPIQPEITCYYLVQDCFILEGNEEDYYKLKNIDKEIVYKLFTIPYKDTPIQTKILKSLDQVMIQQKLICLLLLNFNYYITCIKFDSLNYEINENQLESIKIQTNIVFEETCDEFYQLDSNLIIFCMSQHTLRQYSVSFLGDVSLMYEYDVSIQIQEKCIKKQFRLLEKNQFIIVLFNCFQWKIFQINNEKINNILESKMNEYDHILQKFTKIDNVQFCQINSLTLCLFEGNNYLQIIWESKDYKFIHQSYQSENLILKIVLFKFCSKILLITYKNDTDSQTGKEDLFNEIILNYSFDTNQIHFFDNFLFLQNQTELNIRIDEHLYQKYEILNSSLNFLEQDNLFYQIDQSKDQLQFYRYFLISGYIQPKQQFVYLLQKYYWPGEQSLVKCYRIQYENKTEDKIILPFQILIQKNCQDKQQTKLKIPGFSSFLQQEFEFHNDKSGIVKLTKLENLCYQRLKRYNFKGKITLQSLKNTNHLVFYHENNIYFHNCKQNQIQKVINTQLFEVLEDQGDYYIIDKTNMKIEMIQLISGLIYINQIRSNIEIIRTYQTSEQIIIEVKNQETPILVVDHSQGSVNYLSQHLYQPEQILYYLDFGSYKFIQYSNIFAFELYGEVKCVQLSGVLIVQIKNKLKGSFLIWAVQNQTNSIILYHFEEYELHQQSNYTLKEYQFSNPLKYTYTYLKFAILIQKNQSYFIAAYSFTNTAIKLIDIISTDDTYFQFINNTLLYLNNGQLLYHYLDEIIVFTQTNGSTQNSLFDSYELTLNPTYRFEDDIKINILIQNVCQLLYPKKNSISFTRKKDENLQIKISEIFLGPIHNLTIKDNQSIKLKGPMQFIQEINNCIDSSILCIKQKTIVFLNKNTKQLYQFSAIILKDKVLCEFIQSNFENDLSQVYWISNDIFIWFFQLNDELHIQLIQCILEDDQNCRELQVQIINFKVDLPINENISKTKNLVKLKNKLNQTYLHIQNQNFSLIQFPNNNLDIKYIEQSEDQFIALQRLDNKQQFEVELIIYQINVDRIQIQFSQIITKIISNLLPTYQKQESFKNIGLVSCKQNINIQNGSIFSFHLTKQIRNPSINVQFKADYVDENYLILKQFNQEVTYFYDLQDESIFYDSIYRLNSYIKIIRINTTHFIFINQSLIHFGILKYEIDFQNIENSSFNFTLFAQNDVSNAQISILLMLESSNDFHEYIIVIQLLNLVFIILELRYLSFRKIQRIKIKNLKKLGAIN